MAELQVVRDAGRHLLRMVGNVENLGAGASADGIDQAQDTLAVDGIKALISYAKCLFSMDQIYG